jgi:hypothetical protein
MPLLRMRGAAAGDDMNLASACAAGRCFDTALRFVRAAPELFQNAVITASAVAVLPVQRVGPMGVLPAVAARRVAVPVPRLPEVARHELLGPVAACALRQVVASDAQVQQPERVAVPVPRLPEVARHGLLGPVAACALRQVVASDAQQQPERVAVPVPRLPEVARHGLLGPVAACALRQVATSDALRQVVASDAQVQQPERVEALVRWSRGVPAWEPRAASTHWAKPRQCRVHAPALFLVVRPASPASGAWRRDARAPVPDEAVAEPAGLHSALPDQARAAARAARSRSDAPRGSVVRARVLARGPHRPERRREPAQSQTDARPKAKRPRWLRWVARVMCATPAAHRQDAPPMPVAQPKPPVASRSWRIGAWRLRRAN